MAEINSLNYLEIGKGIPEDVFFGNEEGSLGTSHDTLFPFIVYVEERRTLREAQRKIVRNHNSSLRTSMTDYLCKTTGRHRQTSKAYKQVRLLCINARQSSERVVVIRIDG